MKYYSAIIMFLILILENIGRNKDINYLRMSWLLDYIAQQLIFYAEKCGLEFARLSSFLYYLLEYLDLIGLKTSVCDITIQLVNISFLPTMHFFKGYFEYATKTFLNSTWMIIVGSMILIAMISFAIIYRQKNGSWIKEQIINIIEFKKQIVEGFYINFPK